MDYRSACFGRIFDFDGSIISSMRIFLAALLGPFVAG
jgi:hypothetical protein